MAPRIDIPDKPSQITAMPRFGESYQMLCDVQQTLVSLLQSADNESLAGAAHCAREVREIEIYKRELRGKPRLKAIDALAALRDARAPRHAALAVDAVPAKDEGKESLNCQTVTAPPAPETPDGNG
jgi:hypothetical protein